VIRIKDILLKLYNNISYQTPTVDSNLNIFSANNSRKNKIMSHLVNIITSLLTGRHCSWPLSIVLTCCYGDTIQVETYVTLIPGLTVVGGGGVHVDYTTRWWRCQGFTIWQL